MPKRRILWYDIRNSENWHEKMRNDYDNKKDLNTNWLFVYPSFGFFANCNNVYAAVGNMIASLGRLLQFTLASNKEMVSVQEEIACLEDYVEIQKMRFGEKFQFEIKIPEALLQYQVPLLIFQPIVENSILHAFDDDCSTGMITIGAVDSKEKVNFYVQDNGKGMNLNAIGNLTQDEFCGKKSKFSHVGLKNVDERIKMIYGAEYGISQHIS